MKNGIVVIGHLAGQICTERTHWHRLLGDLHSHHLLLKNFVLFNWNSFLPRKFHKDLAFECDGRRNRSVGEVASELKARMT